MNSIFNIMKIICFIYLHAAVSNQEVCTSSEGVVICCRGFVWNKIENRCTRFQTSKEKCEVGFIGPKCEFICPYPMFGNHCLSKCHCSRDHCNHAYGCLNRSNVSKKISQKPEHFHSTTSSPTESINEVTRRTNTSEGTRKRIGYQTAVIEIFVFGLSALAVIMFIIYMYNGSSLRKYISKSRNPANMSA